MRVEYSKRFIKQAEQLDKRTKKALGSAIKKTKQAESLENILNCIKLSGHKKVYRIRISNHRAIFVQEIDDTLFFEFIVSRGEVYDKKYKDLLKDK